MNVTPIMIELPCNVGETVYIPNIQISKTGKILKKEIIKGEIDHFTIGQAGIPLATICTEDNTWYEACDSSEYCLTIEQAEAEIEEMEANAEA